MHAGGLSHALEFRCIQSFFWVRLWGPSLQLLFSFPDLASRLAVGGHASTQPCLMEPFLLSFSLVLHGRPAPFPQLPLTTAFMGPFSLCTLFSRGASLSARGFTTLLWIESALLSVPRVSALLQTLLSCASCSFSGQTPVSSEPVFA